MIVFILLNAIFIELFNIKSWKPCLGVILTYQLHNSKQADQVSEDHLSK